jgi:hypothetical protein
MSGASSALQERQQRNLLRSNLRTNGAEQAPLHENRGAIIPSDPFRRAGPQHRSSEHPHARWGGHAADLPYSCEPPRDPALPLRRLQLVFRLGRTGRRPAPARPPGRRGAGDGRKHLLHRRQHRGQGLRRLDRHAGVRGPRKMSGYRAHPGPPGTLRRSASPGDGRDRRLHPARHAGLDRRSAVLADRPRAQARERRSHRPQHQAHDRRARLRGDQVFDRHRAEPVPRQDRVRHAEARRADGAGAVRPAAQAA